VATSAVAVHVIVEALKIVAAATWILCLLPTSTLGSPHFQPADFYFEITALLKNNSIHNWIFLIETLLSYITVKFLKNASR
jgi:hypothetical protein